MAFRHLVHAKDGNDVLSFNKKGAIQSIRKRKLSALNFYYIALLKMGHVGEGYSNLKLINVMAHDKEELIAKLSEMPRVKSAKENFILGYKQVSRLEFNLCAMLNDLDGFLNERNLSHRDNFNIMRNRIAGNEKMNEKLRDVNKAIKYFHNKEDISRYEWEDFDDFLTEYFAPKIVIVGDKYNPKAMLEKSDRMVDDQFLYEYFKNRVIKVIKAVEYAQTYQRFKILANYIRLQPKFKHFIEKDPHPLRIFVEELKPGDDPFVFGIYGKTETDPITGEVVKTLSKRDLSKTQYAICYVNSKNEIVRALVPENGEKFVCKMVDIKYITEFIQRTYKNIDQDLKEKFNFIASKVVQALHDGEIDISGLDSVIASMIKESVDRFAETFVNKNGVIKIKPWYKDFDGDFLSVDFFNFKEEHEFSEDDYMLHVQKMREQKLNKFKRLEKQQELGEE